MNARLQLGHAGRYADRLTASLIDAQARLKDEFLAAVRKGDMSAPAMFAPMVNDRSIPPTSYGYRAQRFQTVGEVLTEALDFTGGPTFSDAMGLICAVAWGDGPRVAQARVLLDDMAGAWAKQYAETQDEPEELGSEPRGEFDIFTERRV